MMLMPAMHNAGHLKAAPTKDDKKASQQRIVAACGRIPMAVCSLDLVPLPCRFFALQSCNSTHAQLYGAHRAGSAKDHKPVLGRTGELAGDAEGMMCDLPFSAT